MELTGLHGTTKSRADSIINSSFQPRSGRLGTGVYFWRDGPYSLGLTRGWYSFSLKKGQYDEDSDSRFCYFKAKINVKSENFLNLEDLAIKDKLAEIARRGSLGRKIDEKVLCGIIDYLIKSLEKELNIEYKVLQGTVNAPYNFDYPLALLGNPLAFAVIDCSCITGFSCFLQEDEDERQIFKST